MKIKLESIIFTGDWQLDVANIANVERTVDDIIDHARAHGAQYVIHTGDVKDALSPIDGRVINAMVRMAQKMNRAKLHVYSMAGNHDYYATTNGSESWAGFLRSIGWHCFEEPTNVEIGGWEVFFFPFAFDVLKLKDELAKTKPKTAANALQVFHQGLMGARLSMLRRADSEPLTVPDLHAYRYLWSIGGHYHAQHNVEANVYYCGSPFCTRWDEANQTKGFMVVKANGELHGLPSSIPGWFDPSWPGFPEDNVLPCGARVRVSVPLERGVEPGAAIAHATGRAEALYTGADIVVAPTVIDRTTTLSDVKGDATDNELVDAYVKATFEGEPANVQFQLREILYDAVARVSSHRRADLQVTFDFFEGENFLSFEKLVLDYHNPAGLRVVYGINEDRPGRSNGSGKTGLIQAPLAVLFGETLKGQKHDGLKRRGCGRARSYGRLGMTLADGRALVVERSRQPVHVKLWLDGADISTGKGDAEIKRDMEKLTGLTFEVAAAALYVDQREVNQLLVGRPAERKAVLAAFLNQERFAKAVALVKAQADTLTATMRTWETLRTTTEAQVESYEGMLELLRTRRTDEADEADRRAEALKAEGLELGKQKQAVVAEYDKLAPKFRDLEAAVGVALEAHQAARAVTSGFGARRVIAERSLAEALETKPTKCFECGAPLKPKDVSAIVPGLRKQVEDLTAQQAQAKKTEDAKAADIEKARKALKPVAEAIEDLRRRGGVLDYAIGEKRTAYKAALQAAENFRTQQHGNETEYINKLRRCRAYLRNFPHFRATLDKDMAVLQMAIRALNRDGIPAMMAALLCPRLNASATHYAHLLGDGTINVVFSMDGDELAVDVANPTGGESVRDQSAGELRMAALVTTLALRDSVRSNVLFLDEMSLGLDALSARELARGITQLKDRFASIFVTSHDPYVLNGLEDYTTIEVRKQNGISKVTTGIHTADRTAPEAQDDVQGQGGEGRGSDAGYGAGRTTKGSQRARRAQ